MRAHRGIARGWPLFALVAAAVVVGWPRPSCAPIGCGPEPVLNSAGLRSPVQWRVTRRMVGTGIAGNQCTPICESMLEIRDESSWHRVLGELVDADLSNAILGDVYLPDANLSNVSLAGADLRKATFRNARLENVDLRGADLRGADLTGCRLINSQLSGARFDATTRWPVPRFHGAYQDPTSAP